MRDLAILTFQTLDGVMQGPSSPDEDRSGGFSAGGWAAPYWPEVMAQVKQEAMAAPYDILFGRKTYEMFAAHWPNAARDPVSEMMNAARKYVVSGGSPDLAWRNSHLINGDIPTAIAALKRQPGPLLQVHGSAALLQTLMAHDLVDEYRIWTFPAHVGSGKRLFETAPPRGPLSLLKSGQTPGGVIMTLYRKVS